MRDKLSEREQQRKSQSVIFILNYAVGDGFGLFLFKDGESQGVVRKMRDAAGFGVKDAAGRRQR